MNDELEQKNEELARLLEENTRLKLASDNASEDQDAILLIGKLWRHILVCHHPRRATEAARQITAVWRGNLVRRHWQRVAEAATRITAVWRGIVGRRERSRRHAQIMADYADAAESAADLALLAADQATVERLAAAATVIAAYQHGQRWRRTLHVARSEGLSHVMLRATILVGSANMRVMFRRPRVALGMALACPVIPPAWVVTALRADEVAGGVASPRRRCRTEADVPPHIMAAFRAEKAAAAAGGVASPDPSSG